jgi:SAM-dependent methyltransferase
MPLQPAFFKNKIVLDAGCGFGRHSYYAAKYGAEVVALDLSEAVDAARDNLAPFALSHVVQADLLRPPLQKKFDFVFSIGVLHHLPNPEGGFRALAKLLRSGDEIFAWVYGREGRFFKTRVMEGIHSVTKHLPFEVLYALCVLPALLYHSVNLLYKFFKKIGLNAVAERLPFKYYANFPFRVKHADSFDFLSTQVNNYYTREEFFGWFKRAGLKNIRVTSFLGKSWRGFGVKP